MLDEEHRENSRFDLMRAAFAAGQALLLLAFLFFAGTLVPEQTTAAARSSMSAMPASAAHSLQARWDALRTLSAPERKSLAKAGWSGDGDGWLPHAIEWRFAEVAAVYLIPGGDDGRPLADTASFQPRAPPSDRC